MSQCRSCHAEIVWAVTTAGRLMPLNPEPVEGGNVRLRRDLPPAVTAQGSAPRCEIVETTAATLFETEPETLHMPHHATCPHADRHRNR